MIKKWLTICFVFLPIFTLSTLCAFKATAATVYPRSSAEAKAGDVLHCAKGKDSYFVGHVGIVGENFRVFHCVPDHDNPGRSDRLSFFVDHFTQHDYIDVYRYSPGGMGPYLQPLQAARWADHTVGIIREYNLFNFRMGDVTGNYCSKFLWQCYYFGANVTIDKGHLGHHMTADSKTLFDVDSINFSTGCNGSIFEHVTQIRRV